ncbi:MAG TPA: hypothetical protein VNL70_07945, partial [Tepidisphaeraceae bacterium]|nr:hypothetical protein [Tepidisphaeraceae bacterium]
MQMVVAAAAAVAGGARVTMAIDQATGRLGSNIQAVRDAATRNANEDRNFGWNLNGTGVNLGQIEGGRPGDPDLNDNPPVGPAAPELFHPAIDPGGGGLIGVAIAGATAVSGIDHNMFLSDHATQVAGMMVAQNAGGSSFGAAPRATLFSSTLRAPGPVVNGTLAQRVVAAGQWMQLAPATRIVNHSYGLGRAA